MKKILAICLMIMVLSMGITAFAAPNGFVSSPSGNPAPTVDSFTPADDDCTAQLVIVPYGERQELSETLLAIFEKAHSEITSAEDLTKLNADLAKIAADMDIKGENLAVSDLFDIHVTGCDFHDGHLDFDIVLNADTLKHFVGLLHMNKDGEWELVKDAKVVNNGKQLHFSVETLSPFAVVVDTTSGTQSSPQTGDNSMIHIYVAIMIALIAALMVLAVKIKKLSA